MGLLILTILSEARAQIIDDSTKQIYGAYTTFYTRYKDYLNNEERQYEIDTLIGNLHNYTFVNKSRNHLQDLGNLGTAMNPVFYTSPDVIGARSGFDAYTPYYHNSDNVRFYDTKSPYSMINANFGGGQRTISDIVYTRNITPYWNAGFKFTNINSQKQVKSQGRNDFQVRSVAYHFHTHYLSPNGRYTGLGYVSRINHRVREQGGIVGDETTPLFEFFDDAADIYLENAESRDFRVNVFTYNQYRLENAFQLYHTFEYIENTNRFTNRPLDRDINFHDRILISRDSTVDQSKSFDVRNEAGIKGTVGKAYYRLFARARNFRMNYRYIPERFGQFETYAGYHVRMRFDSLHYLRSEGEYLIAGNYKLEAVYRNKFFDAEFRRIQYDPSVIQLRYFGNHGEWSNSFRTVSSDYLAGSVNFWIRDIFRIRPMLSITNVNRQVYWNEDKTPQQASGSAQLLSPGLFLYLRMGDKFFLETEARYTLVTGTTREAADAFRIPEIFANTSLYYTNELFERRLNLKAGIDIHYKSAYQALAYDPVMQQFHLQNWFTVPQYALVDAYVNTRVSWATIFLKMENLAQPENGGYFTFPQYRGIGRTFTLGITWSFFD